MGKEITSLVKTKAIERNRCNFSILIDIAAFWLLINLGSEVKLTHLKAKSKWEMDSFLSLFNNTVEKDQRLCAIMKTIPRNATYTRPDMQNKLIAAMSSVVTEGIKQKIGNSWHAIKVDGAKSLTGVENILITVCFLNEHFLK